MTGFLVCVFWVVLVTASLLITEMGLREQPVSQRRRRPASSRAANLTSKDYRR